jgi:hypothetical protein
MHRCSAFDRYDPPHRTFDYALWPGCDRATATLLFAGKPALAPRYRLVAVYQGRRRTRRDYSGRPAPCPVGAMARRCSNSLPANLSNQSVLIKTSLRQKVAEAPGGASVNLAEREGFEPSMELLTPYSLSRGAPSAARPPLQIRVFTFKPKPQTELPPGTQRRLHPARAWPVRTLARRDQRVSAGGHLHPLSMLISIQGNRFRVSIDCKERSVPLC